MPTIGQLSSGDTLSGGNGVLLGGSGTDTRDGDADDDIYVFGRESHTLSASSSVDTITVDGLPPAMRRETKAARSYCAFSLSSTAFFSSGSAM